MHIVHRHSADRAERLDTDGGHVPAIRTVLAVGALGGLVAALAMTALMLVSRELLGLPTPSEMVGDRLTAFITIQQFFALLNQFGGYEGLKQAGGGGVIAGQLVVGVLAGVAYARYMRMSQRPWLFAAAIVGALWLLTVALLWPNLSTNYRGLPPDYARIATLASLLVAYTTYGLVLVVASRFVRTRVTNAEHTQTRTGRRAFLLGGVGAILAVATGGLLRQLAQVATFAYDGMEYRGEDVQPITPNDRFYTVTKNFPTCSGIPPMSRERS